MHLRRVYGQVLFAKEIRLSQEEIIHAVEKVCSLLPAKYSGLCDIVIEGYGQKIIQALVNDVPPEKVCSTVGLCSSIKSLKKTVIVLIVLI